MREGQHDMFDAARLRGQRVIRELDDDVVNVLESIQIAIVVVDVHARIKRLTPRAMSLLGLGSTDLGRPLGERALRLHVGDVIEDLGYVLGGHAVVEREVDDGRGSWYRLQIRPYRHADRRIGGAVFSFVDITGLRATVETARASRDYAASIIETLPNPLAVLDTAGRVCLANRALCELLGAHGAKLFGRPLFAANGGWRSTTDIAARLATSVPFDNVEVEWHQGSGARLFACTAREMWASGARLVLVGLSERRRAD